MILTTLAIEPSLRWHSTHYVDVVDTITNWSDSPELYLRKMALTRGVTLGSTTDVNS